jgi:hypothetical protein
VKAAAVRCEDEAWREGSKEQLKRLRGRKGRIRNVKNLEKADPHYDTRPVRSDTRPADNPMPLNSHLALTWGEWVEKEVARISQNPELEVKLINYAGRVGFEVKGRDQK